MTSVPAGGADVVVFGRLATLAGDAGFGWAEAIAIEGGRVVAAGSAADVEPAIGPRTRRIVVGPDLVVVPGITDAHLHLADSALATERVDLERATTLEDGLAAIAAAGASAGQAGWTEGGGWDPSRWGRWPTAADLRGVAPDRRVALWSHDHHALWVSERVLRELGVDARTPDPPGGTFRRDAGGSPTGVLQETAAQVVIARLPRPDRDHLERAIARYAGSLVALGVVGVHDPGDLLADATLDGGFGATVALADRGGLPIRVHASIREPALPAAIARGLRTGASLGGDDRGRARMGWLKLFADGALGSRTAHLLDPYEGTADARGVAVTPGPHLAALSARAAGAGIVPQIHAIGDAALRSALDALEPIAPGAGPMARVEHVQLADPTDLLRMARARIGASIQPIHLRPEASGARAAWGDRAERRGFLLRSLAGAGITVAFGTDAPVEPADPWPGLALAVTRAAPEWADRRPYGPAEAIALADALRAATAGPAAVAGDRTGGRLIAGSPADFVAIPAAALREPVEPGGALWTVRPAFVAIGGRIVHES